MTKAKYNVLFVLLFFLIGIASAVYFHWPALKNYTTYKSDIRQCPHWAAYHKTSFQDDDLLIKYGKFNESPIQNLIFYFGTYFADMVTLSKIIAVIGYGFAALLFFLIGKSLFGLMGGIFTAVFFLFFPYQFEYFAGGFSKMWIVPLILVCVYFLKKEQWRGFIILIPFSALAYPMTAVLIGMVVLVYWVINLKEKPQTTSIIFRNLALGSMIAVAILLIKYLFPSSEIGAMPSGSVLANMPEMYKGGLCKYLPVPPLYKELLSHISHPFVIYSSILFFLVLGKNIAWDKTWTALLIASVILYFISDIFFMHIYIPNRYTRHSMVIFLILWNARNWDLVLKKIPWKWVRYSCLVLIFIAATFSYKDTLKQGMDTFNREKVAPLCKFLRTLPEKILIAGHPRIMDDIPIQARRSVLCNYKMAHPWFSKYYKEIKERKLATFRAMFSANPEPINELYHKYGVNYFVIGKKYMKRAHRRERIYVNPYENYIRKLIRENNNFLLDSPPQESIVYEDDRYIVIKLPLKK